MVIEESALACSSSPGGAGIVHAASARGCAWAAQAPKPREPSTSKAENAPAMRRRALFMATPISRPRTRLALSVPSRSLSMICVLRPEVGWGSPAAAGRPGHVGRAGAAGWNGPYGKLTTSLGVVLVGVVAPVVLMTLVIEPLLFRETVSRSCHFTPAVAGASYARAETTAGLTLKKQ